MLSVTSNTGATSGRTLYSVSADGSTTTTINITPLTDMIIRAWYQTQGTSAASAIGALINGTAGGVNTPPTPTEVGTMVDTIKTIFQSNGVINASGFDPITGAISVGSGSGYDAALDDMTGYDQGGTGVTIVLNNGSSSTTIMVTPSKGGTVNESTYDSSTGQSTTSTLSAEDYTASGTYTYGNGNLIINTTSSTFPCNGPEVGKAESWIVNASSSSMTWTKVNNSSNVMTWTASGTVSGVNGAWTMTDPSNGGQYTATINANGTWSVTGSATSCGSATDISGPSSSASANGTYTYSNGSLIINTTSTNFPCDGPSLGGATFAVSNATSTSMTWAGSGGGSENIMNWTRISGSGSGMAGTWTSTNSKGDSFTATMNSDDTWSVLGNIASSSCESDSSNFDTALCNGDSTTDIINGTGMGSFSTTFNYDHVTQTCDLPVTVMQDGASVIVTGGSCSGAGGTYSGNGPITGTWTGCLNVSTLTLSQTYNNGDTSSMKCSVSAGSPLSCTVSGKVPVPGGDSAYSGTGSVTPSGSGM